MAESRLKVILETSGMSSVKAAMRGINQLKAAVKQLDGQIKRSIPLQFKFARSLKRLQIQAIRTARGIRKAAQSLSSLQGVLGGLAIGAFFKSAIDEARDYEAAILRIGRLEGQFKNLAGLQETAAKTAKDLFVSQTQAARGYANLAARIGPSVGSVKELQAVYEGLEIVLLKNAKSTQEAASLQLQLNQALGKGVLNGDEFRTISENAPEILRQLAKDAGVAESAIKDLSSKGFVTTKKLIKALANLRNSGIEDFNALLETTLGKQRKFDAALADFRKTIGDQLLPVFTPFLEALTAILNAFTKLPNPVKKFTVALAGVLSVGSLLAPIVAILTVAVIAFGAKILVAAGLVAGLIVVLTELPGILQSVGDKFQAVGKFFVSVWEQVTKFIGDQWKIVTGFLNDRWKETLTKIAFGLEIFGQDSSKIFEGVGSNWSRLMGFMGEQFSKLLNGLGARLEEFFSIFKFSFEGQGGFSGPLGALFDLVKILAGLKFPKFGSGGGGSSSSDSGLSALNLDDLNLDTNLDPNGKANSKAAKEAERRAKAQRDQLRSAEDLLRAALDENAVLTSTSELEKIRNQAAVDRSNIAIEYGRLAEKALSDAEVETLVLAQSAEILNTKTKEAAALNDEYKKIARTLEAIFQEGERIDEGLKGPFEELAEQVIPAIGDAIKNSMVTALEAAIKGTEDLGKALQKIASNLLLKLGGMFLDAGFAGIGKALKLPGYKPMAEGGYVTGPTPALIGEGGEPEYVLPESRMSEALSRYANGARGDAVIPDGASSGAYAGSGNNGSTIVNYNGPTLNFNGDDYVPASAVPGIIDAAAAKGAKAGELRTFSALRNNRSSRARIGI